VKGQELALALELELELELAQKLELALAQKLELALAQKLALALAQKLGLPKLLVLEEWVPHTSLHSWGATVLALLQQVQRGQPQGDCECLLSSSRW
jgi:hypothetical protein